MFILCNIDTNINHNGCSFKINLDNVIHKMFAECSLVLNKTSCVI
nr:MAG TPA: hypothetical protein [Caudoviricetes sp.]